MPAAREIETTTKSYRFVAGIGGMLGDWSYDIGLTREQQVESTSAPASATRL
jgi:hypothetical protein